MTPITLYYVSKEDGSSKRICVANEKGIKEVESYRDFGEWITDYEPWLAAHRNEEKMAFQIRPGIYTEDEMKALAAKAPEEPFRPYTAWYVVKVHPLEGDEPPFLQKIKADIYSQDDRLAREALPDFVGWEGFGIEMGTCPAIPHEPSEKRIVFGSPIESRWFIQRCSLTQNLGVMKRAFIHYPGSIKVIESLPGFVRWASEEDVYKAPLNGGPFLYDKDEKELKMFGDDLLKSKEPVISFEDFAHEFMSLASDQTLGSNDIKRKLVEKYWSRFADEGLMLDTIKEYRRTGTGIEGACKVLMKELGIAPQEIELFGGRNDLLRRGTLLTELPGSSVVDAVTFQKKEIEGEWSIDHMMKDGLVKKRLTLQEDPPYIPLQWIGSPDFIPEFASPEKASEPPIRFRTRYGLISHPYSHRSSVEDLTKDDLLDKTFFLQTEGDPGQTNAPKTHLPRTLDITPYGSRYVERMRIDSLDSIEKEDGDE